MPYLCRKQAKQLMKISIVFSKKTDEYGHSEAILLIRRKIGNRVYDLRAKSNCFVNPTKYDKATNKVELYKTNKLPTPEVRRHNEQVQNLNRLIVYVDESINTSDRDDIKGTWLAKLVSRYNYPNKDNSSQSIYALFSDYIAKMQYKESYHKGNMVMIRSLFRFEQFKQHISKNKYELNISKITKDDLDDFRVYLINEYDLCSEYPNTFSRMSYPEEIGKGSARIEKRGENSVIVIMKKLRQFFKWLNDENITTNEPFKGFAVGTEKYGTPFYITSDEREIISSAPMPTQHLSTQRDIFIFHCFIGCRISDLIKLTADNITNGVLTYTPHKTQDEGAQALQARIPLHHKAKELITQYEGKDEQGRLFPFISNQKYNDAIKEIFKIAGITRKVEVRNALTGEIEQKPINEVASSHLARRTFVGNLYFKVQDPNLIGKMSGHTEGSKAFSRYRKIEDETLKDAIDLL